MSTVRLLFSGNFANDFQDRCTPAATSSRGAWLVRETSDSILATGVPNLTNVLFRIPGRLFRHLCDSPARHTRLTIQGPGVHVCDEARTVRINARP